MITLGYAAGIPAGLWGTIVDLTVTYPGMLLAVPLPRRSRAPTRATPSTVGAVQVQVTVAGREDHRGPSATVTSRGYIGSLQAAGTRPTCERRRYPPRSPWRDRM
ncbi:hypothetical protein BKD30_08695 [Tersicoccus phoenicis]|uniref:Uncharacterized protein n=1 Tax=Tersicoccus phoenicis TaxID=554083 RepID=A0A1R1LA53_9MICC|nr:hypothetical protein [Tersicoccus phoenicis]OMH24383.1 hypothetical protein BKD30_08695 [Tersicoccus phoenicis]